MAGRGGQRDRRPAPRRVPAGQWFDALDRAGPGATNEQLAALVPCVPDSVRRYRRRFGDVRPAELPPDAPDRPRRPAGAHGRRPSNVDPAPPPVAIVPAWTPPSGPGRVVYGYRMDTGEPFEAEPASCFVPGLTRSGKSNTFAVLLRQLGGRLYLADGHAGGPGSLAELLRQPGAPCDQAGAVAIVAEARAELDRRIEAARAGHSATWEPWTVVLDEFDRLGRPDGPLLARMLGDLLTIATQGAKFSVFALIGTQTVAGPMSAVPPALRSACGLIVHQVGGRYVFDATGVRTAELPANPARFAVGEALVRLPGRSDLVHVRWPLAPADGEPLAAPALPAVDIRKERRALDMARGRILGRVDRALAGLRDVADPEADALRGALRGAAALAKEAASLAELHAVLGPYGSDVDAAEALAPPARAAAPARVIAPSAERRSPLAWLRDWWDNLDTGLPELHDQEPDDDQDEPDRAAPRALYVVDVPEPADVQAEARERAVRRPHRGAEVWRPGWGRSSTSAELLDAEAERVRQAERERFGY